MNVMIVHLCSLEYGVSRVYFELDNKIDKSETPSGQFRAIAFETVERRFLSNLWTYVYTEGYMIERGIGAAAIVYCNHFAFYEAVGRGAINFDGEIDVVFIALKQLSARESYSPRTVTLPDLQQ
ncbi:uncharacterized protein TNCV_2247721 [Trichonephila clavipes]|nr:uncharacterized protein TNCV_2247721 [Trichonephila clavipes]